MCHPCGPGDTVADAVLMVIGLIAEFVAELNTERARASIKALAGWLPQIGGPEPKGREKCPGRLLRIRIAGAIKARLCASYWQSTLAQLREAQPQHT